MDVPVGNRVGEQRKKANQKRKSDRMAVCPAYDGGHLVERTLCRSSDAEET
mgnify:CR=1 FL=1